MKTRLLTLMSALFVLMVITTSCGSDDDGPAENQYYWFGHEKVAIQEVKGKYRIAFHSVDKEKITSELAKHGLSLVDVETGISYTSEGVTEEAKKLFKDYLTATVNGDYDKIRAIKPYTFSLLPYYTLIEDGRELIPYMTFDVKLKDGVTQEQLETLATTNNVILVEKSAFLDGWYTLACTNDSKGNPVEMANLFYRSGLCEYSQPSFGGLGELHGILR